MKTKRIAIIALSLAVVFSTSVAVIFFIATAHLLDEYNSQWQELNAVEVEATMYQDLYLEATAELERLSQERAGDILSYK